MIRPDFRHFRQPSIQHSAKGSEWEKHKYLKKDKIKGYYYYPDSYEGGRHLPKGSNKKSKDSKEESTDKEKSKKTSSKKTSSADPSPNKSDIQEQLKEKSTSQIALDVISGKLGNASQYKEALGARYDDVQKKIKEIGVKAQVVDASKKDLAKSKKPNKRNSIKAPGGSTKQMTKEEKEEAERASRLQAKTIIRTDEDKSKDEIQNPERSNKSSFDRLRAASEAAKQDLSKYTEDVINKNAAKVEEALKKVSSTKKASSSSGSGKKTKSKKSKKASSASSNTKTSKEESTSKKASSASSKSSTSSVKSGVDMNKVLGVYRKKKK